MTDDDILENGMQLLIDGFGLTNAERFVGLVNQRRVDYTEWRRNHLFPNMTVDDVFANVPKPELVTQ
ncbi:MAG: hypothetical protein LBQ50_05790 [Planctomycetaceae bacterium]|nr:hypothetical protein [Planctomycetaceae bacterium]